MSRCCYHAAMKNPDSRQRYIVHGMHCAACAVRIQKTVAALPGVQGAQVLFATQVLEFVAEPARRAAVVDAVLALGYQLTEPPRLAAEHKEQRAQQVAELEHIGRQLKLAFVLTVPMWLAMIPAHFGPLLFAQPHTWMLPGWCSALLATPVQFWFGLPFYRGAWRALKQRTATMDTLVALGTSVAYFYSVALLLGEPAVMPMNLYFESAATVITLVSLGRWLEARARAQAMRSLDMLAILQPAMAHVWKDNDWRALPVAAVRLDDRVLVRPGEAVPVDAEVVEGESEVDEALLTGESLPVQKRGGSRVVAGSINVSGALTLRVTAVGEQTALAHIIRWVENAQASRAPIQQLVDRISAVFVPMVLGFALLTWLGWAIFASAGTGLMAAVSVLVIACPCALGLATPMAMVVCTDVAARYGILLRDIDVLERAARIRRVIFDKTGTLTVGHAQVVQVLSLSGTDIYWMSLVASLAGWSEHPYARAARDYGVEHEFPPRAVDNFRNGVGRGMGGRVDGRNVLVGNRDWLVENRVMITPRADEAFVRLGEEGNTVIWVAVNDQVQGFYVLADPVRADAQQAIALLHNMQIECTMLTGDTRPVAQAVAAKLSLDSVVAGCKPEDKALHIRELQQQGVAVAMVGDGVNDAPALAQADLSLAIGSGTDIANQSAGISLMRNDLLLVPWALTLARAGRRKIRENLFWAFVFNVVGIPLAAAGWLNPGLAGAAMAFSSVAVVGNALLLQKWRPPQL